MKLRYQAHKPNRYKNGSLFSKGIDYEANAYPDFAFTGVSNINWADVDDSYFWLYSNAGGTFGSWVLGIRIFNEEVKPPFGLSSHFGGKCRSVKAFRRRLKQWSRYMPAGVVFELTGLTIGTSVIGRTY